MKYIYIIHSDIRMAPLRFLPLCLSFFLINEKIQIIQQHQDGSVARLAPMFIFYFYFINEKDLKYIQ